jgi:hypothetical protein
MPPQESPERADGETWTDEDYDFVQYLWSEARSAAQYACYFGHRTHSITFWARWGDIVVAVAAPVSVISGLAFWKLSISSVTICGTTYTDIPVGNYLWAGLGAVAAVIAAIKPIVRPDLAIASGTRLYTEYRALRRAFEALVRSIQRSGRIDKDIEDRYEKLEERMNASEQQRPPKLKDKLFSRCLSTVLVEMPVTDLWAPKVPGRHPRVPGPPSS